MKYKIKSVIFILIITTTTVFAQNLTKTNNTDDKGLKQGYWEKHYPNGNIQYSGNFKDNQPFGIFKRFDSDGVLIAEMNYIENSEKVYTKFYYPGKTLQAEGYYIKKLNDYPCLYLNSFL